MVEDSLRGYTGIYYVLLSYHAIPRWQRYSYDIVRKKDSTMTHLAMVYEYKGATILHSSEDQ